MCHHCCVHGRGSQRQAPGTRDRLGTPYRPLSNLGVHRAGAGLSLPAANTPARQSPGHGRAKPCRLWPHGGGICGALAHLPRTCQSGARAGRPRPGKTNIPWRGPSHTMDRAGGRACSRERPLCPHCRLPGLGPDLFPFQDVALARSLASRRPGAAPAHPPPPLLEVEAGAGQGHPPRPPAHTAMHTHTTHTQLSHLPRVLLTQHPQLALGHPRGAGRATFTNPLMTRQPHWGHKTLPPRCRDKPQMGKREGAW